MTARRTCSDRRPASRWPATTCTRSRTAALAATGLADELATNVFRSIVARAVELVHAAAEAADLIDGYERPSRPAVDWKPVAGTAAWATEAPRGLLFHRYEVDDGGHRPGSADRAAHVPEPGRHRGRPGPFCAVRPRPAARRGDAALRAAHPQLRPVHLVRGPFPGPAGRGGSAVTRSARCSFSVTRCAATTELRCSPRSTSRRRRSPTAGFGASDSLVRTTSWQPLPRGRALCSTPSGA